MYITAPVARLCVNCAAAAGVGLHVDTTALVSIVKGSFEVGGEKEKLAV